jgi:hypothetical protein
VREVAEALLHPAIALLPDRGLAGVLHPLEVGVDLGALDALQVVADADVVGDVLDATKSQLLAEHRDGEVGLDVFVEGLRHRQLGGPLAVVALVGRLDAGLGHGVADLLAVHLLNGLELHEPGAGEVGDEDVVGELGLGTSGRPEREGHPIPEGVGDDRRLLRTPEVIPAHTED